VNPNANKDLRTHTCSSANQKGIIVSIMKVACYLTFKGDCAKAFDFYKSVFGGDFTARMTWGDSPMKDQVSKEHRDSIMHICLPIPAGGGAGEDFQLMGSEYIESLDHAKPFQQGNNMQICLTPDTTEEADILFAILSEGGEVESPLKNQFWGAYHGTLTDAYGIRWMIDCAPAPAAQKASDDEDKKEADS
jgi:PhnB protein